MRFSRIIKRMYMSYGGLAVVMFVSAIVVIEMISDYMETPQWRKGED